MCGIMRCPSPPQATARCVGYSDAHLLHRRMTTKGLTNVLKGEDRAHSPCHACSECAYLSVDVREVGQQCPSTHTHDGTVGCTTQFHGHGTPGLKAVRRYSVESVALCKESVARGSPADRGANVTVCDRGCASIGVIDLVDCAFVQTRTDVRYSPGEGCHRAKRSARGSHPS